MENNALPVAIDPSDLLRAAREQKVEAEILR
jgi:hypothetical protein